MPAVVSHLPTGTKWMYSLLIVVGVSLSWHLAAVFIQFMESKAKSSSNESTNAFATHLSSVVADLNVMGHTMDELMPWLRIVLSL